MKGKADEMIADIPVNYRSHQNKGKQKAEIERTFPHPDSILYQDI
jgi:hypothetical protein